MANNRGPNDRRVPVLNSYVKARVPKDEDAEFSSLAQTLASGARKQDEKQLKLLLQTTVPRLCMYSGLPPSILPSLIELVRGTDDKKDHKKLIRQVLYVFQLILGQGDGGTPRAQQPEDGVMAPTLDPALLNQAWEEVMRPASDLAHQRSSFRVLGSVVRAIRNSNMSGKPPFANQLAQALATVLSKDYQVEVKVNKRGLLKFASKKPTDTVKENEFVRTSALSAVRIALSPGGRKKIAPKAFPLLTGDSAVAARHALALASELAERDPEQFIKNVGRHLDASLAAYGETGYLFPMMESSSGRSGGSAGSGEAGPLTLTDSFARVYLARGCATIVHGMGPSKAKNTSIWRGLVLLACNDPAELVAHEAIKNLAGALAPRAIDIGNAGRLRKEFKVDSESESKELLIRRLAWVALLRENAPPAPGKEAKADMVLLSQLTARIKRAITSGSQTALCGGCRSAMEVCKTRAYAMSGLQRKTAGVSSADEWMNPLRNDLMVLATSSWHYNASQQSLALHALIWLQGVDGGPLTPPVLTQILSSGDTWSQEILSELLQTLFHRLVVEPSMAVYILDCVNALVAGCPSKIRPVELVDFWSQAFEQANKTSVLRAALQFLEAPLPPRVTTPAGANPVALARSTEESSSWRKLRRIATWWLGEAANFIADEYAWDEKPPILGQAPQTDANAVIAAECTRCPLLMTTIAHLQHTLFNESWGIRLAATKSLTTIAFRSGEPYRIQIYRMFKDAVAGAKVSQDSDPLGLVLAITPILELLDAMYAGQIVVENLVKHYGGSLEAWPEELQYSLAAKHEELLQQVARFCSVPAEVYFPLGPKCRALMLGEEIVVPEHHYSMPQAEYADFVDQHYASNNMDAYQDAGDASYYEGEAPQTSSEYGDEAGQDTLDVTGPSFKHMAFEPANASPKQSNASAFSFKAGWGDDPGSPGPAHVPQDSVYEDRVEGDPAAVPGQNDSWQFEDASPPWESTPNNEATTSPAQNADGFGDYGADGVLTQTSSLTSHASVVGPDPEPEVLNPFEPPPEAHDQVTSTEYAEHLRQSSEALDSFPATGAVMYNFEAELEGELTVVAGDLITIIAENDGWYLARSGENEGLVPCSYIAMQPDQ